jgi:hypothetical protein
VLADLWGWGCVVLHMVTGEQPWAGLGPRVVARQVADKLLAI